MVCRFEEKKDTGIKSLMNMKSLWPQVVCGGADTYHTTYQSTSVVCVCVCTSFQPEHRLKRGAHTHIHTHTNDLVKA